jgi:hypothetical protein
MTPTSASTTAPTAGGHVQSARQAPGQAVASAPSHASAGPFTTPSPHAGGRVVLVVVVLDGGIVLDVEEVVVVVLVGATVVDVGGSSVVVVVELVVDVLLVVVTSPGAVTISTLGPALPASRASQVTWSSEPFSRAKQ